ncbi:MAG: RIP metalloprotease RseP [Candidatus Moraniibacteriota bacterium]|jgi:regulator of sigma E protease
MFIVILILIIGTLVFVHELGHFVVARRNGVKASEFGFGFPPRIVGFQFLREVGIAGKKKKLFSKWRIIWGGKDGDDENEISDLTEAHEKKLQGGTIYSLNWFPLGGFVKIKGEDGGNKNDADSFAGKSAWKRIKILAAGVVMNFIFAWFLLSIVFMLGAPEQINSDASSNNPKSKIQISEIVAGAPASVMGLKIGDEILKTQKNIAGEKIALKNIKEVQDFINANKGQEITLEILRGKEKLFLKGTPRIDAPQGQGALGIALAETSLVKYPWFMAIWKGLLAVWDMIAMIFVGLFGLIKMLFAGHGGSADVAGPVGIAILTKEVANLGLVYLIQFAAILSVNLGIVNILPIPALDGGRILFILIEKIKGSPVSQKVEQTFHTLFFALLMLLMLVVTYKDIARLF